MEPLVNGIILPVTYTDDHITFWSWLTPATTFPLWQLVIDGRNPDNEFSPGFPLEVNGFIQTDFFQGYTDLNTYPRFHLNSTMFGMVLSPFGAQPDELLGQVNFYPMPWDTPDGVLSGPSFPP